MPAKNISPLVWISCLILGSAPATAASPKQLEQQPSAMVPLGIALESFPYPYPVQFLPLTIAGQPVRMAYMDIPAAAPANGQSVVLLHGKNMGGWYFEKVIKLLSHAGYRVIVPDQIGWGKSSKPDIEYTFDMLAANTNRLLDELKVSKVVVLGHSTGGMLAVRFARTYSDRVTALILEDPIGLEDYRRKILPQTDETIFQAELANTDPQKIQRFFEHYFYKPTVALTGPLAEPAIRVTLGAEWPRWARQSAQAYQMIYRQPVCYEFDLLTMPTLLIVGQQDHAVPMGSYVDKDVAATMGDFPKLAGAAASKMPQGTVIVVPQCGHIPHLEQPAIFDAALLEFLGKAQTHG